MSYPEELKTLAYLKDEQAKLKERSQLKGVSLHDRVDANFYFIQWGIWYRSLNGTNTGCKLSAIYQTNKPIELLAITGEEAEAIERYIAQRELNVKRIIHLYYAVNLSMKAISDKTKTDRRKVTLIIESEVARFSGYLDGLLHAA
ncbi:hypothetical protein [Glaciecola sp. KUL10]|uniref:hypothetical protein n=1 Tax=Glaciecola sp. (strain KUL10) TaxID=2161813 RepID=UPI000D7887C7|nr:hypothetical protein [Glaciecola sp. KUL10]GBL02945.1 hypothetical protein KUL10_02180 [Glaciecola sp. KUL10]